MFLCILSPFTFVLFVLQLLADIIGDLQALQKRSEKEAKEEKKSWIWPFWTDGVHHLPDGIHHLQFLPRHLSFEGMAFSIPLMAFTIIMQNAVLHNRQFFQQFLNLHSLY